LERGLQLLVGRVVRLFHLLDAALQARQRHLSDTDMDSLVEQTKTVQSKPSHPKPKPCP